MNLFHGSHLIVSRYEKELCNMVKYLLSFVLGACLLASPALAGGGGGGGKKDATIKVTNSIPAATAASIVVIADPPASLVNKVRGGAFPVSGASVKDITAAGGVIIKPGKTASLSVKSGDVPLGAVAVLPGGVVVQGGLNIVKVAKGATVSINANSAVPVAW